MTSNIDVREQRTRITNSEFAKSPCFKSGLNRDSDHRINHTPHCHHSLVECFVPGLGAIEADEVPVLSSAPFFQTITDHLKPHCTLFLKEFSFLNSMSVLSVMVSGCPFCGTPVEREWNAD
jgi:hypothetical protein